MFQLATCWIKLALLLAPHRSPDPCRDSWFVFCRRLFLVRYVVLAVRPPVILASARFTLLTLAPWRHLLTDQSSVLRETLSFCSARAGCLACRRQYYVHVLDAFTPESSSVTRRARWKVSRLLAIYLMRASGGRVDGKCPEREANSRRCLKWAVNCMGRTLQIYEGRAEFNCHVNQLDSCQRIARIKRTISSSKKYLRCHFFF